MSELSTATAALTLAATEMKEAKESFESVREDTNTRVTEYLSHIEGVIESQGALVTNLIIKVENLLSDFLIEIETLDRYLLLFPLGEGDFQFHGTLSLINYTAPFMCDLNIKKAYNSTSFIASINTLFGDLGVSVCSLNYNGMEYLALRNNGELNRVWRFTGKLTSQQHFKPLDSNLFDETSVNIFTTST